MDRPSLTLNVGDHELRWTYGLQQDMQRMVPDAGDAVSVIMGDPYVRDYLVRRALTPAKKMIEKDEDLIQIEDTDLDPDQVLEILDWIAGHLLYFFAKSASTMARLGQEFKKAVPQLPPSTNGSEA